MFEDDEKPVPKNDGYVKPTWIKYVPDFTDDSMERIADALYDKFRGVLDAPVSDDMLDGRTSSRSSDSTYDGILVEMRQDIEASGYDYTAAFESLGGLFGGDKKESEINDDAGTEAKGKTSFKDKIGEFLSRLGPSLNVMDLRFYLPVSDAYEILLIYKIIKNDFVRKGYEVSPNVILSSFQLATSRAETLKTVTSEVALSVAREAGFHATDKVEIGVIRAITFVVKRIPMAWLSKLFNNTSD